MESSPESDRRQLQPEYGDAAFFSHTDPEARRFTDRYWRAGFNCAPRMNRKSLLGLGGENIAYNSLCSAIAQRNGRTTTSWRNTEELLAAAVVGN